MRANNTMTFYGQEKVEYNAQLCLMNLAVHGLTGVVKSGDEANTFYHDAHNLEGCCDYVMANPPFNVDKVKSESAQSAGRLPFGLPSVNKNKEIGNGNYLWISYFYAYLNERGRAGFVMASSATDSQGKDKDIREQLVKTGHVDVMVTVGNNFFYTKSLPCSCLLYTSRTIFSFRFDQMKIVLAPADVHIGVAGVFLFGSLIVGFNVSNFRSLVLGKAENGILRFAHTLSLRFCQTRS